MVQILGYSCSEKGVYEATPTLPFLTSTARKKASEEVHGHDRRRDAHGLPSHPQPSPRNPRHFDRIEGGRAGVSHISGVKQCFRKLQLIARSIIPALFGVRTLFGTVPNSVLGCSKAFRTGPEVLFGSRIATCEVFEGGAGAFRTPQDSTSNRQRFERGKYIPTWEELAFMPY